MKYLSVCSGIEAATVAWHGLGWQPVAFAEIEPFPAAVLAHHYPTVPNLGNLTKYREWPEELLAEVDLLVGGTPCQAFSVAGKRQSLDDERGNLSLIYVNLYHHINEVRRSHGRPPAIALWENVPGVLSTKDNAFGCFIGGLLGCDEAPATESGKWDKAGFLSSETVRVGYRVLDAQYFGVAQRRRRVFLAAVPCELVERFGERACPSEILSLRESVLGNPPTRGASWERAARTTAAGLTGSGRGVERPGESQGQDDAVISKGSAESDVYPTLDAQMNRKRGGNQWVNNGFAALQETAAHSVTCFHPTQDPISSTDGLAHSMGTGSKGGCSSHGVCVTGQAVAVRTANTGANGHGVADEVTHTIDQVQGQAIAFKPGQSEAAGGTFVTEEFTPTVQAQNNGSTAVPAVAFKPPHYTRGKDGAPSEVVAPLSADADKGDQDTVVATPIDLRQASRGEKVTNNRSQGAGGPPGHGIGCAGEPAFTVSERGQAVAIGGDIAGTLGTTRPSRGGGQAVAIGFKQGANHSGACGGLTEECEPPLTCGQDHNLVAFTKAKRAQSNQDDESWVPGDVAPTQNQFDTGDTRATTVVAFAQNSRDEVRQINGDGSVAGALSADAGMHQTNYLAFAQNQLGEVRTNPDVMGTVNQNQNASGRNTPMVFANRTRDGIKVPEVMKDGVVPALTNPGQGGRADAVNVQTAMQVRRLCPSECEALQGFPIGYTDVQYRKKPAADGPKYRALGNSMAVPCMWWLGYRIDKATRRDNT